VPLCIRGPPAEPITPLRIGILYIARMKLARLRQQPNNLPIIEIAEEFLFASTMLVHIERMAGVALLAKRSWAMSDSFEAIFAFRGHRFCMELRYGCIMIFAKQPDTPRVHLDALAAHIDNYQTVWPAQLLWAFARYFFLPFKPEPEHIA
jgi:hypothetical protein